MRRYVAELQPRDIRELAAMVALYRPGPMEHIPRYIDVKHGRATPVYPHADLASVLDETYGVITYQDQVLEIARTFAGYTLGQADIMRKAMGKKIAAVMVAERERFITGAVDKGYDQRLAEQVFDLIEPFAGYAFNKAHAFSYGTIAYQTAYLKAHYPIEYMAAVLMAAGAHPTGALERVAAAIAECTRLGIDVRQPDVNRSMANFAVERQPGGGRAIRFGLATIKHVGSGGVESLIAERETNGQFASLEDFARRINPRDLNRRVLESLAKAGALDELGDRCAIVFGVDRILSLSQQEQRLRETGQTSMFDLFGSQVDTPLPALELQAVTAPQQEVLSWERELLGTYLSEHPFRRAAERLGEYITAQLAEVDADSAGQELVVAGTVKSLRRLTTKQGKSFAAVSLEDMSGTGEMTVWPEQFEQHRALLVEGNVVLARVNVRERGDRLTVAAQSLAGYDSEGGQLLTPDLTQFRSNSGGRSSIRPRQLPPPSPDGPRGGIHLNEERAEYLDRPALRAVEPMQDSPGAAPENAANEATSNVADVAAAGELSGPPRLRVTMEETTDEAADRRRLKKIVEILGGAPGEQPVELAIMLRTGTTEVLRLPGIADIEAAIPQLQALLGVLGNARRIGDEAYERVYAMAAG